MVFDRFDAPQPIGSGLILQPTGLAILEALGLKAALEAHGRPIVRMFGRNAPQGRVVLDVRYGASRDGGVALAVHRSALFGVLFDAAQRRGVAFEGGFEAVQIDRDRAGRPALVDARGRRSAPFDWIVDASGARSRLAAECGASHRRELVFGALWATLPWPASAGFLDDALEQRYRRADVMVGVLPIGRRWGEAAPMATFFWSLKPRDYDAWRARGLDAWREDVLSVWPQVEPILASLTSPDELSLARYGHHALRRPYGDRLGVIGDAAHATSPQLGQGANMGLLDAAALAAAIERHSDPASAFAAYARARRSHVRLYQALSAVFTPVYQSDSRLLPALRDLLLDPVSRLPGVRQLLTTLVRGELVTPIAGLKTPRPATEFTRTS